MTPEFTEHQQRDHPDLSQFQLSPQPSWIYDIKTLKFLDINEAATIHYGYSRAEFLSMTLRDIRPAEDLLILEHTL